MLCPVDGAALAAVNPQGALQACPRCDGQLAQTETLARIVKHHGFDLLKLKPDAHRSRNCPGCWKGMKIYDLEGLEIDLCPVCALVWMDAEEWPRLRAFVQKAGTERAALSPAGESDPWYRNLDSGSLLELCFDLLWDGVFRKW